MKKSPWTTREGKQHEIYLAEASKITNENKMKLRCFLIDDKFSNFRNAQEKTKRDMKAHKSNSEKLLCFEN